MRIPKVSSGSRAGSTMASDAGYNETNFGEWPDSQYLDFDFIDSTTDLNTDGSVQALSIHIMDEHYGSEI